jgi:hypothetical protein
MLSVKTFIVGVSIIVAPISILAQNATIDTFVKSFYTEQGCVEASGARNIVKGDISGDGIPEIVCATTIEGCGGGNAAFPVLGIFSQQNNGQYRLLKSMDIGFSIDTLLINNNILHVSGLTYGENDARCCPSIKTEANYTVENGDVLTVLPISISYREALLGNGKVLTLINKSQQPFTTKAMFYSPSSGAGKTFTIQLAAGETQEFGHLEGWAFESGDEIQLTAEGYGEVKMVMP